jgi:putative RecB family exonuclease
MIARVEPPGAATMMAERLTGRAYLSWSAISTFLKCPLKYQYHYLDQLPEEFVSANLIFGSAIHSAFQAYFQELLSSRRSLELRDLLEVYHENWSTGTFADIQFGKSEDMASLGNLAERMLQSFLDSDISQPAGSIIGIEEEFQAPLIANCPDLFARLDLVVESDHAVIVTDFKTARSRWSTGDVHASEGQLVIYHELVQRVTDKPVRLQFAVLTKTRQPEIQLHVVEPDPRRISRIRQLIHHVWIGIQSGNFYPVPSAMNCPTCGYRDRCALWNGSRSPVNRP